MSDEMRGKVCLITGCARGIGRAVAEKMAEQGGTLLMMDINEELLTASAAGISSKYDVKTYPIQVDASSMESVKQAMDTAFSKVGVIDVLANCAGVSTSKLMMEVTDSEWDFVMNVNLRAVFAFSRLVADKLIKNQRRGHIVSISSQASKLAEYGNGTYCISKSGVNMLTQVLGLELAPYNISVSAVCPGIVDTEMINEVCAKRGPIEGMTAEQYREHLLSGIPAKRMADPGEIADLVVFLASDKAEYITGVTVTIAGGTTLI